MQTIYKDMYEGPSPQTESGPGALLVHLKSEPGISCTVQYRTVQYRIQYSIPRVVGDVLHQQRPGPRSRLAATHLYQGVTVTILVISNL